MILFVPHICRFWTHNPLKDPRLESRIYKEGIKNKRVSENLFYNLLEWDRRLTRVIRVRGCWGDRMLRNKVRIKKMVTDNGLVVLIPSVECRDPGCSSECGIRWIRKVQTKIKRSKEKRRKDLPPLDPSR